MVAVILILLIGILLFPAIVVAIIYNTFIYKRNVVKTVFSTIDVLLKKRFDLVPNLVETVKGYSKHEQAVFTRITELRNLNSSSSLSDDEKVRMDSEVRGELSKIMAVVENYPEIKADKHYLNLQHNLTEIEDQISAARRAYNAAVTDFNNSCEMFPFNIFASIFGFKTKQLFQIDHSQRANVNVNTNA
ncbi:MAG: LemA family protein [Victivallales bacterium]|nr:LemA family protein [Victivallales bacterium]